jgi:hypothetical protein
MRENDIEESRFVCETCNFKTNYKSENERHINSAKHKRGGIKKSYPCDKCSYITNTSLWNLKMHKSAQHSTKEEREKSKYYCKLCDSIFFSPLYYNNHLKSTLHKNNTEKENEDVVNKPKISILDNKLLLMKEEIKKELYEQIMNDIKILSLSKML